MTKGNVYLENISKSYQTSRGTIKAVDDITIDIDKGEFLFLLGPSGCGKTTSLRIIAGLVKPDSGNIHIDGTRMNNIPVNKRKLGMVFQNYALFPHFTVFENIAFGMKLLKTPKDVISKKVKEILSLVRLDKSFEVRYPSNLSGGQQQRIALARAIATSPNVLLLDEPFGALDRKLRKEMQVELKELHKKLGITLIFVTHDQEEALTMGDRVAVMHNGKIVQLDSPEGIYERPATRFIADFIGETNLLEGKIVEFLKDNTSVEIDKHLKIRAVPHEGVLSTGASVTLSIRPEKIKISNQKPENYFNCFKGIIKTIIYLGDKTHYYIVLENGQIILSSRQNDYSSNNKISFEEGDKIFLYWDISNSLVLMD
jgi:spermidine/putrescine transport system ATP-binding protein